MRIQHLTAAVALATALGAAGAASADTVRVKLDDSTVINGVGVACTGIGQTKNDPKWHAYPVKVEFADAQRAYVSGETVTVSSPTGDALLTVSCEGPWVLLKLPTGGAYNVEATLSEHNTGAHSIKVKSPAHGQAEFVITFPEAH